MKPEAFAQQLQLNHKKILKIFLFKFFNFNVQRNNSGCFYDGKILKCEMHVIKCKNIYELANVDVICGG